MDPETAARVDRALVALWLAGYRHGVDGEPPAAPTKPPYRQVYEHGYQTGIAIRARIRA